MLPPVLLAAFPDMDADGGVVTDPDGYWPPGVPDELTVAAVVAALATVGYTPRADGGYEHGFEKAAVYARDGVPTHVARQLAGGGWSSKLDRDCTVRHATPGGVEGAVYGSVAAYLRRPAP
jgi:hypothetical protein